MDPCFSPLIYGRMLRVWAIDRWGKNLVRNLQYGPRTRLVRGIYFLLDEIVA